MILLSFFSAEVERRRAERNSASIIYAIEEPETSQHTEHQKILTKSLLSLAEVVNTQVIITTHSASVVRELSFENLRMVLQNGTDKGVNSVDPGQLPYPSLNEVNFLAFSEALEEYHNELYGFIDAENKLDDYKYGKDTMTYIYVNPRHGSKATWGITLTEYVRHQIHHPENELNTRYTYEQLSCSIQQMREFLQNN